MADFARQAKAQNVNIVGKFEANLAELLAVLGKSDVSVMAPGSAMKIYKSSGELKADQVAEGAEIAASTHKMDASKTVELTYSKYRKVTGIESIGKLGYDVAVLTGMDLTCDRSGVIGVHNGARYANTGIETVIVPPPYSLRLRAIVRECEGRGDEWLTDDGFGDPMCPNNMAACYKRWFIGRPLRYIPFSNLRNAYGTIMHARGVDLSMVAKLMGHAQPGTTYRHYDRPSTEQLIQAVRDKGR